MKTSILRGLNFGLTSGAITTLGLIIGLGTSTNSKLAVIGGLLTIAIADAMSDALGIHISEESTGTSTKKEIWESTAATFLTKFIFALTFLIPILFLPLTSAIIVNIIWGIIILIISSYKVAKSEKARPLKVIREHLLIAISVIIITYFLGQLINFYFTK